MTPEPLTGRQRRVCACCGRTIGLQPCIPQLDGSVSHGLCGDPECKAAFVEGRKRRA
jgi:hypothetical protein